MTMREIFKPAADEPANPGRVFYTITAEDVGKVVIITTIGAIHAGDIMGRVQLTDVGKRLYRVPVNGSIDHQPVTWFWQAENDTQRDARLARTAPEPGRLVWHWGKHPWESHDGYPRHQHSLNGALTIAPGDTRPHFAHGPSFS